MKALVLFSVLACPALAATQESCALADPHLQQAMVWLASAPPGKQVYAIFRKQVTLAEIPVRANCHIFADSRYILWVNGHYIERGPGRFDPQAPEYDTVDLKPWLQTGANQLAVLVHHYHDGKASADWSSVNGRIMRHEPGLAVCLDLESRDGKLEQVRTDGTWRGSTQTRFLPSEYSWTSIPDRIDARRDPGDWTAVELDDSKWELAAPVDGQHWGLLRPRSRPRLRETEAGPLVLVERSPAPSGSVPQAPVALAQRLPATLQAGEQWIIDAGSFVQGYTELEFEATGGSELELEYAQNYRDSGRKLTNSHGQLNRYTARAGKQSYLSGDTYGFKYLALRLKSGQVQLMRVRVVNRVYPFMQAGSFHSSDPGLNQLWTNCVRTIQICSEDAYVDCASRERVEWMADGYVVAYRTTRVALAGPDAHGHPLYGDPRLLRSLLRHIGQSRQPDGRLKAHHPSDRWDIHGYIEDYACLWVQGIREYFDHTGDLDLVKEQWPALAAQLKWFLDHRRPSGLVLGREFVYFGNPLVYKVCEGTTLNAFLHGALRDAAVLARVLGKTEAGELYARSADQLREAMNRVLWEPVQGTYRGAILDGQGTSPTAHAAVMALHFGVVPSDRQAAVHRWLLANHSKEDWAPYTYQFLLEEIFRQDTSATDREALNVIRKNWSTMLQGETGTVWEGFGFGAGEYCHEAGAVPASLLSTYVLGVRLEIPLTKRRLLVEPHLADLSEASGVVVTEHGLVDISWRRPVGNVLDFRVAIPEGVTAAVRLPAPTGPAMVEVDGQVLVKAGERQSTKISMAGGYWETEIGPGIHAGRISGLP